MRIFVFILFLSVQCFAGIIQDIFNFPNPFSKSTTVDITLSQSSDVEIRIYNLSGDLVRKENIANVESYRYEWKGKNDNNMDVADGIYILAVVVKEGGSIKEVKMRKVAVLR